MNNRNDKLENRLKQYFEGLDMMKLTAKQKAYVLDALMQLYKAAGDEDCFKMLEAEVSKLADSVLLDGASGGAESAAVAVDGGAEAAGGTAQNAKTGGELANLKIANAFYYAADVTGEERYIEAAKKAAKQLAVQPRNEAGIFVDADESVSLGAAYLSQVFYMKYETVNGGKERYNDIIAQYNSIRSSLYDAVASKISVDAGAAAEMAEYCAALIDTMEVVDQPLYEIFRRIQDLFKEAVKALIEAGIFTTSATSALRASYAVLKGCRMKALHTERYEKIALKVLDTAISDIEAGEYREDVDYVTALAICYSESLKNREYQDYGRGKGGALWS